MKKITVVWNVIMLLVGFYLIVQGGNWAILGWLGVITTALAVIGKLLLYMKQKHITIPYLVGVWFGKISPKKEFVYKEED